MPKYLVTTRRRIVDNGYAVEPGAKVYVISRDERSPLYDNNGEVIRFAYMVEYHVDLRHAKALNTLHLDIVRVK